MQSYKTFIKNSRTLLSGHLLIYAQGIILIPIIIKSAGPAVYGGYVLLATLLGFIFGVSSFGVGFKCGRFLPSAESREARRDIFYPQFWFQLCSILVVSVLFAGLYPFFETAFLKDGQTFFKWLVFPFLLSNLIYSQTAAYFVSTHRVKHFNYATVAHPYLNILLVILAYYFIGGLTVNILFLCQIAAYILVAIPLTFLAVREIGVKSPVPDLTDLREDMRLGLPLRLNYVTDVALGSSDRYLLAYFISVAAVGCYNPGYALGSLIIFVPKVSNVVLVPLLSKAVDGEKTAEARNMLNYAVRGYLLLAIPFIAGAAVLSGPLLKLFANAEVASKAWLVTPVVAAGTLFLGLNMILSNALWVKMKTTVMFKMNLLAVGISITLNIVLLYFYKDLTVAAFTALISYATVFFFVRRAVTKVWPVDFGGTALLKAAAAAVVMGAALYAAASWLGSRNGGIGFLLLQILFGIAVYAASLFVFRTFSNKEMTYIRGAFSLAGQ